jgi:uncharacterized membrane protein YedE/YeeE
MGYAFGLGDGLASNQNSETGVNLVLDYSALVATVWHFTKKTGF